MKRFLAFILCAVLMCAMPIAVMAEEEAPAVEVTEEAPAETEPDWDKVKSTISDKIVNWILPHIEEISVIVTMVLSIFYQMRKHAALNKSMGVMNNNTIAVAENSATSMQQTLSEIVNVSDAVTGYEKAITALLEEYRQTAEEKKVLEKKITEFESYLKSAKDSNIEFSNELAELLVLANIPNAKKDELYARHRAAVEAIEGAAKVEVKEYERHEEN